VNSTTRVDNPSAFASNTLLAFISAMNRGSTSRLDRKSRSHGARVCCHLAQREKRWNCEWTYRSWSARIRSPSRSRAGRGRADLHAEHLGFHSASGAGLWGIEVARWSLAARSEIAGAWIVRTRPHEIRGQSQECRYRRVHWPVVVSKTWPPRSNCLHAFVRTVVQDWMITMTNCYER